MLDKPKTEKMSVSLLCGMPDLMVEVPYGYDAKLVEIVKLAEEGKIEEARQELEKGF